MAKRSFKVWRGDKEGGGFEEFQADVDPGMVVLDVLHRIQAKQANDLALRWNCKAGKCGSCSMEINGKPRLACMTRMNSFTDEETISCQPLKTFPVIKDLVTDVSWNYRQNQRIAKFKPKAPGPDGKHRMYQEDVDRVQEFRKCIECFLCQDVCHVIRDRGAQDEFVGPALLVYAAGLEMHPLDVENRVPALKNEHNIGYCNITGCCTKVCPEHITITDNAIIPLKERVVDTQYDPLGKLVRAFLGDA